MIPGGDVLNLQGSYFRKTGRMPMDENRAGGPYRKIPTIFIRDGDIMIKHMVTVP
jgi:hypothetical protein